MAKTKFNLATEAQKKLILANKNLTSDNYSKAIDYYKEAIALYLEATQANDNSIASDKPILDNLHSCYYNIAASYIKWAGAEKTEENLIKAIKILEDGLKEFSTSAELFKQKLAAHNNLSNFYLKQHKFEEAIAQWEFVEKSGKQNSDTVMFNLKTSLAKQQIEDEAPYESIVEVLIKAFNYLEYKGGEFAKQNLTNTNYICNHLIKYKILKGEIDISEIIKFSDAANVY